jgi:hypothetical protein
MGARVGKREMQTQRLVLTTLVIFREAFAAWAVGHAEDASVAAAPTPSRLDPGYEAFPRREIDAGQFHDGARSAMTGNGHGNHGTGRPSAA